MDSHAHSPKPSISLGSFATTCCPEWPASEGDMVNKSVKQGVGGWDAHSKTQKRLRKMHRAQDH
jgi:hypothetical protein